MASFSRGLAPRFLFLVRQQAPAECAAAQARLLLRARFSTSRLLQKAVRTPRPPPKAPPKPAAAAPKPTPKPVAAKPSPILSSAATQAVQAVRPTTYAEQLALRGRTLLYESPSHFWFRAGCFSSAAFCVSYSVYQYWAIMLYPPEGLMWWIPHAFGVILIFMTGMGAYFALGAGRIVRSIEAVPAAAVAKQLAAKAAASPAAPASPIYIEVATRRMLPFAPPKKVLLAPEEIQLPFRMHTLLTVGKGPAAVQKPLSLAEQVRAERAARDAKIAERKYTMDHLMTAPFRDAGKALRFAFAGVRRSFSREGFAKVRLGKQDYKLDVTGGWALDEGRAMDRLLPVRPNAMRSARKMV